jgi:hypothetical protein
LVQLKKATEMRIQLDNFKSFRSHTKLDLVGLNVFIGGAGTGKSTLSDCLALLSKNFDLQKVELGNLPNVCSFDSFFDWRHYVHQGRVEYPVKLSRTVLLFGMELNVELHYKHTNKIHREDDEHIKCAEVVHLSVYHERFPIVIWNEKERKIFQSNFYQVMLLGMRKMPRTLAKEWERFCSIPNLYAKKMNAKFVERFLDLHPKMSFTDRRREQYSFGLGDVFQAFRWDIKDEFEFYPLMVCGVHLFIQVIESLSLTATQSVIMEGNKQPTIDQHLGDVFVFRCQEMFGIGVTEKKLKDAEGRYFGKQLYLNYELYDSPFDFAGSGMRRAVSWVYELVQLEQMLEIPMGRQFITQERLVILKNPERDLHPDWLFQWIKMVCKFSRENQHVRIVIETQSPLVVELLQSQVRNAVISSEDVNVYSFTRCPVRGSLEEPLSINWFGDISGNYAEQLNERIVFQLNKDALAKDISREGVMRGN